MEIVEEGMKKWLYEHQKGIMRFLDGSWNVYKHKKKKVNYQKMKRKIYVQIFTTIKLNPYLVVDTTFTKNLKVKS